MRPASSRHFDKANLNGCFLFLKFKVGYTALVSRAAVIGLSIVSNALLPDHKPIEEVFSWTESPTLVSAAASW